MADRVRMDRRYDWVGPPDKISKIRSIKLRRVENETPLEAEYRQAREELNHFWAEHNRLFESKRDAFVAKKRAEVGRLGDITANDMSIFYKDFLNERHSALMNYNRTWYRRNLSLIIPAIRVNLVRFSRLLRR